MTAAKALANLGDSSIFEVIFKELGNGSSIERESVYLVYQKLGVQSLAPFIKALSEKDRDNRIKIINNFRNLKVSDVTDILIRELHDEDPLVFQTAAVVLGDSGDKRAIKPLCKLFMESDRSARFSVISALNQLEDIREPRPYIKPFNDGTSTCNTHYYIIEAMRTVGGSEGVKLLFETREELKRTVWDAVVKSLVPNIEVQSDVIICHSKEKEEYNESIWEEDLAKMKSSIGVGELITTRAGSRGIRNNSLISSIVIKYNTSDKTSKRSLVNSILKDPCSYYPLQYNVDRHFNFSMNAIVLLGKLQDDSIAVLDYLDSFCTRDNNMGYSALTALRELSNCSDAAIERLIRWHKRVDISQRAGYELLAVNRATKAIAESFRYVLNNGCYSSYSKDTAMEFFENHPQYR